MVYPNRIHKSLTSSRVHRQGRADRLPSFMSPAANTNQANSEVNDVDMDAVHTVPLAHVNVKTIPAEQGFDEGLEHDQFLESDIPDDFEKPQIYQDSYIKDVLTPEYPFNNDEYDSIQFMYSCVKSNMTVEAVREMKRLMELFTNRERSTSIQKTKFYAPEAGLAMIKRRLQLDFVREYEICSKKSCYLFDPIIDVNMATCPQCGAVRRATSVVKMVDIGDHLARMRTCNAFRKEVEQYREVIDAIEEGDPYTDFFSGLAFKELKAKGLFSGKHNLAIVLCVDGFTSKVFRQSIVMVQVIIPSIDPSIRDLDQLSKQPLVVKRNGEHVATSNVFRFGVIADGVEINQRLLMFGGHTGFYGFEGVHPVEDKKGGMYFIKRDAAMRSEESLLVANADNTYGIKKPSPFGQLNTFLGIDFFFCDELHMLSNVSKLCFDILSPSYNTRFEFVGNESNGSSKYMHSDNVRSMYRSVDWIAWLMYVVPTIVAPLLPASSITKAFIALSLNLVCSGLLPSPTLKKSKGI
ncbi:hypothetical protein INT47_006346 [Mucor saturninus]|uniref:Uncharacterized protein n=1 Tax=Mucor saturninus TaxID=64648 RepID=A0A8H7RHG8_9FUNG|nr:hypothetical protein INT47_006346 [Mucor saturninus]